MNIESTLRPAAAGVSWLAARGRRLAAASLVLALVGCPGSTRMEKVLRPGDMVALSIGEKTLQAELANDSTSRNIGLMRRSSLPGDQGMLFIWPDRHGNDEDAGPQKRSFWMRNTLLPLSIAFIDDDGKILQIEDMVPLDERRVLSKDEVRYALEMSQGWFQKNGIKAGDAFKAFRETAGKVEAQ